MAVPKPSDVIVASKLFTDKNYVKPNRDLKSIEEILHRDKEIWDFYNYLKDIYQDVAPSNLFIYGFPGLGKTQIAKLGLVEIEKEAILRKNEMCWIYINCDINKTEHALLQAIIAKLPVPDGEERRTIGNSVPKHLEYVQYLVDNYSGIIILILDELDKSHNPEMINTLIRLKSKLSGHSPTLICITNDLNLRNTFEPHLRSVLSENELVINPYTKDQIIDIINSRVKVAFEPNIFENSVIPVIADYSLREGGDIRKAIDLLRATGEVAEKNEMLEGPKIIEIHVKLALKKLEQERILQVIEGLPEPSKPVLLACIYTKVFSRTKCDTTTVFSTYKKMCIDLVIDPLSCRRLREIIGEFEQASLIVTEIEYKGRKGRKKIIKEISKQKEALDILYNNKPTVKLCEVDPKKYFNSAFQNFIIGNT